MKSSDCWIFTADDHVDRRILFHVDPLRTLGLDPVIFAAELNTPEEAGVPILRPGDACGHPHWSRKLFFTRPGRRLLRFLSWKATLPARADKLVDYFPGFQKDIYDFMAIFQRSLSAWQSREVSTPDLIFCIDLPVLPVALWWSERFAVPLIVDCHECWAEQATIFFSQQPAQAESAMYWEKVLYPRCNQRITVGEELAEMMQQRYHCPFRVIYSSCHPPQGCSPLQKDFWQIRAGLPPGARVALFQGRLTPYRNLETLVSACSWLGDNQYVVVLGGGPLQDALSRLATKFQVTDRFRLLGFIPQDELLHWTAHAHLGLLPHVTANPYFSCSAPNKLFEYIAAGIPMIYDPGMTQIGKIAGINGFGEAVCCNSPQTMGLGIASLLADDERLTMFRTNLHRYGQKFLASQQAEKLQEFIQEVTHV